MLIRGLCFEVWSLGERIWSGEMSLGDIDGIESYVLIKWM